jgi:hypothetical protein
VLSLALLAACHPSATVEHTMPVANLKIYRTVALRVHATAFASQGQAMYLESAVLEKLQRQCGFEQIGRAGTSPADVVLDLNITNAARGGGGWISNQSQANLDALLVLTDGGDGELLGTARIHGESSGMIINTGSPEHEAIDIVAKTVADLLAKSGCTGPRVARATPPPPPPPPPDQGSAAPPDEAHRAQADALNEQGKEKLYGADLAGAVAAFQQANALVPDPRYEFNACLALEAQQQWNDAIAACRAAHDMKPPVELAAKIDHRLDLLQHHQ